MNLVQFVYRLLGRFVPVSESSIIELEDQARAWYQSAFLEENKDKWWSKIVTEYLETWWFKTILMAVFVFAVRAIADFMNPKEEEEV